MGSPRVRNAEIAFPDNERTEESFNTDFSFGEANSKVSAVKHPCVDAEGTCT